MLRIWRFQQQRKVRDQAVDVISHVIMLSAHTRKQVPKNLSPKNGYSQNLYINNILFAFIIKLEESRSTRKEQKQIGVEKKNVLQRSLENGRKGKYGNREDENHSFHSR